MSPEIGLALASPHIRHGSNIGQNLTRRDGVLKVTGAARYAADNHPPGMLHAVLAVSSIARGRVTFLDVDAAKRHPGVVEVMTQANKPPLAEDPDAKTRALEAFTEKLLPGRWDEVRWPNRKELKATKVLALPIDEASAKLRTGGPVDDEEDHALDTWAGVIPLRTVADAPLTDPDLRPGIAESAAIRAYTRPE